MLIRSTGFVLTRILLRKSAFLTIVLIDITTRPKASCCYNFISKVVADTAQWAPQGYPADPCLSKKAEGEYGYNVNIAILITVVVCSLVKVFSMLYVAFYIKGDPLMTVSIAIQSFFSQPDKATTGVCLASKADVVTKSAITMSGPEPKPYQSKPLQWRPQPAVATGRSSHSSSLPPSLTITGLLGLAINSLPAKAKTNLWALGFGAVHPDTLITS
jgi:hypothetical protein